jgi:hypothetical protein
MSFSLKDALKKCPGLLEIIEKAVEAYHETEGGWPTTDMVQVTVIMTDMDATHGKAGYASGTVENIGALMDKTFVNDGS